MVTDREHARSVVHLVVAQRDYSDLDEGTQDYPICYYLEAEPATCHARRANEVASTMPEEPGLREEELAELRLARPEMFELDPGWLPGCGGRSSTYVTHIVPIGSHLMPSRTLDPSLAGRDREREREGAPNALPCKALSEKT